MLRKLLSSSQITQQTIRSFGKHNKKFIYKEGERFESVTYYPRTEGEFEDPPVEPTKLFRVQRTKAFKGNPFWEKRILKDLGLHELSGAFCIVKNIPENNARLWKIKHLVKITPITFPYGEPTEADVNHTFLKENGECIVTKQIEVSPERIEVTENFENRTSRMDGQTLRKDSRLKWLNNW